MNVLVTGGHGFIGAAVARRLEAEGHTPIIFDRRGGFLGDIRDRNAVTDAAAHADGIIHLAGILGTQETISNPFPAVETNMLGALNVYEAAAQYDLPAVAITVGNWFEQNAYSISKNAAERFAFMYNQYRGTRIAVVRALNAYGPGQVPAAPFGPSKVRKILPSFICRALAGLPIEVYGDGTQVMDMIHVDDVADVLAKALTVEHKNFESPFEAGTGRPTTVNEIAWAVAERLDAKITHLPLRPGETPRVTVLGDPSTLRPLGVGVLTKLEDALPETIDSYR